MADEEALRIHLAQILAFKEHYVQPGTWRYDGTHASGNQMLRTVDIILAEVKRNGWAPHTAKRLHPATTVKERIDG